MDESKPPLIIVGGGPAGLSAALKAAQSGLSPLLLEQGDRMGGISRTETYLDYHFDVGGHRFFTKSNQVHALWQELMGEDFLTVSRQSRIFYNNRFFPYPLRVVPTLRQLGIVESLRILFSYLHRQIHPFKDETMFQHWIVNRFGDRLFQTFFKTYTEKVWGIPCHQLPSDWAAQRIKSLSLRVAVWNALFGGTGAKSLIEEFQYPTKGPGMLWERCADAARDKGAEILRNTRVETIHMDKGRVTGLSYGQGEDRTTIAADHLISSLPVTTLVEIMDPPPPQPVLEAARSLSYRAFVIVVLLVDRPRLFTDQWIYVHSPDVLVGRIQNFKNWSPDMVPDPTKTSIGMEYFCHRDDEIWAMADEDLIHKAAGEIQTLGLARSREVFDGVVLRQDRAYPIYDSQFKEQLAVIQAYLSGIENLDTVGRNGLHRYNNMDHSMLTGIMAVENLTGAGHDLWSVNEDEDYLEEISSRAPAPGLFPDPAPARMDKLGVALSLGMVLGVLVFSLILLCSLYPPGVSLSGIRGYDFTLTDALKAGGHALAWGGLAGWLFAYVRNLVWGIRLFTARNTKPLSWSDLPKLCRQSGF